MDDHKHVFGAMHHPNEMFGRVAFEIHCLRNLNRKIEGILILYGCAQNERNFETIVWLLPALQSICIHPLLYK
jgi:hypothetical protein